MSIYTKTIYKDIKIPMLGLGTWKINDKYLMRNIVKSAYDLGYRLFDTASSYTNEIVLGHAIKDNGINRDDIFLTDKVWNTNRGYEKVKNALKTSLKKLKLDYIDMYLMHWPASMALYKDWAEINANTWRGMEELLKEGLTRTIGVCNYKIHHLEELKKTVSIMPMVNQIEYHPGYIQKEIVKYCYENNIIVEASSPLAKGELLSNVNLIDIAKKYNKTVSQIILRYAIQNDVIVIPKTTKEKRLKENIDIFDFSLTESDMAFIDNMQCSCGERIDSDTVVKFG